MVCCSGMTVGVVVDGEPVLTKGYGWADAAKSRKVTEDTAFYIASITKSFSASLAGILMDEQKIRYAGIPFLTNSMLADCMLKYTLNMPGQ